MVPIGGIPPGMLASRMPPEWHSPAKHPASRAGAILGARAQPTAGGIGLTLSLSLAISLSRSHSLSRSRSLSLSRSVSVSETLSLLVLVTPSFSARPPACPPARIYLSDLSSAKGRSVS